MITIDQFYDAVWDGKRRPSSEQRKVIEAKASEPLFVVAGPGSGKTTCMALRILKMVLLDGVPPSGIIATTFTVKAADELRSRVLGWGFRLIDGLKMRRDVSQQDKERLDSIDINQVWTGTLDSLCEQVLRDFRVPGEQPPVLADEYVSRTLMLRAGLFDGKLHEDEDLASFLLSIEHEAPGNRWQRPSDKVRLLKTIWDRRHMDLVDWPKFLRSGPVAQRPGRKVLDQALSQYEAALKEKGLLDFASLEYKVLELLRANKLGEFAGGLKVVLVDEYQDTNLLQEQLYFELAKACGGALCVVGDDDQSLYRFRGATVDLFTGFPARYRERFKRKVAPLYLSTNYRSTKKIVSFVNQYAVLDAGYRAVRVDGKPPLNAGPDAEPGRPVLAMFRDTREELAESLADFICLVFRGKGFKAEGVERIIKNPLGGDIGDCALLCSSPAEYTSGNDPKLRLPGLLREQLAAQKTPIRVFNPRGEDFAGLPLVRVLGGLLAMCIDPDAEVLDQRWFCVGRDEIREWRAHAEDYLEEAPADLCKYVDGWVRRDPGNGRNWPRNASVLQLVYGLVHFLPELYNKADGQVYLEVFTRQLDACEQVGSYKGCVVHAPGDPKHPVASIRQLLSNFLGPLASGSVQVDEELITAFPRDQLSILSIHQSKGLEFPLTIVDVGSDFAKNVHTQAFKRFPKEGAPTHRMEDRFRVASELGVDTRRSGCHRAFDDLYRLYFVAYSRPQDVLLLVGLNGCKPEGIPNAATGWDREKRTVWKSPPYVMI